MLDTLVTSKTRIKLLLKFFLNPELRAYLRKLEQEFGEGSNAIRLELNKFEKAGLLTTEEVGNKKYFSANRQHPLFWQINKLVRHHIGVDQIVERVAQKIGNLEAVYVYGKLANGLQSEIIDLILVGDSIDKSFVSELVDKAEALIDKKISYVVFTPAEFDLYQTTAGQNFLLIWNR